MPIKYKLYPSNLAQEQQKYTARVETSDSIDLATIARRMANRCNTLGVVEIKAVLDTFFQECEHLLSNGCRINIEGQLSLYPLMSGDFNSATDRFDPKCHRIDVGATPGTRLRTRVRKNAAVRKVNTVLPNPTPLTCEDRASHTSDRVITPGGIAALRGHRLKHNLDNPTEGIFFIDSAGRETRTTNVALNTPKQLVFLVPQLDPQHNPYRIEIRAHVRGKGTLRSGSFKPALTAVSIPAPAATGQQPADRSQQAEPKQPRRHHMTTALHP